MNERKKVKDLIELACDVSGEDNERIAAAMKAVKLIRKYNLLESPLDDLGNNEFVQAAKTIFSAFNDPHVKKVRDHVGRMSRRGR